MAKPDVVKRDIPFRSDAEIRDLVEQFEQCRWPYERWTHRAHLAIAVSYLRQRPLEEATRRIRRCIQTYNRKCGDPDGYHETLTVFFMRFIAHYLKHYQDGRATVEVVDELFCRCGVSLPLDYYSAERLWSAEARRDWLDPDRKPLEF